MSSAFSKTWLMLKEANCELIWHPRGRHADMLLEHVEITQWGVVIGEGSGTDFRQASLKALIEAVQRVQLQNLHLSSSITQTGSVTQIGFQAG